ncbi:hypothetical protein LTR17_003654 [Elasticomyces elasticus]|nr:hypothetical protein LTR17_003654 [Elasticomyces elasticus]
MDRGIREVHGLICQLLLASEQMDVPPHDDFRRGLKDGRGGEGTYNEHHKQSRSVLLSDEEVETLWATPPELRCDEVKAVEGLKRWVRKEEAAWCDEELPRSDEGHVGKEQHGEEAYHHRGRHAASNAASHLELDIDKTVFSDSEAWIQRIPQHQQAIMDETPSVKCALLALPTELRIAIYRLVFVKPDPLCMESHGRTCFTKSRGARALLIANRQIRVESLPIMYGENTFGSSPVSYFTTAFLKAMPKYKVKLIKKIRAFRNDYFMGDAHYHIESMTREWQTTSGPDCLRLEAVLIPAVRGDQQETWLPATSLRQCRIRNIDAGREQLVLEEA